MSILADVVSATYNGEPSTTLFHYTNLDGLMGIVKSRTLWAGELRFLNDAQELGYFGRLMKHRCLAMESLASQPKQEVYRQLIAWTETRFLDGPFVFAVSFTENGDLLSQWRGYCRHGRGLSLGFDAGTIRSVAAQNSFRVGKCIYDGIEQDKLASEVISRIMDEAIKRGPDANSHVSQSYWPMFTALEADLLTIAALVKHPSFKEEAEWRCVSETVSNYAEAPINYRLGATSLVPYIEFPLPELHGALLLDTVIIGPGPTQRLMHKSVTSYLAKYARSGHPLRTRSSQTTYQG